MTAAASDPFAADLARERLSVVVPDERAGLFSTTDVVRLTDASYRQCDHWCRRGVIVPAVAAAGSGSQRLFDEREVRVVAVVAVLSELGASLDRTCARVAAQLRALPLEDPVWSSLLFVNADGRVQDGPDGSGWLVDLAEIAPVPI